MHPLFWFLIRIWNIDFFSNELITVFFLGVFELRVCKVLTVSGHLLNGLITEATLREFKSMQTLPEVCIVVVWICPLDLMSRVHELFQEAQ